MKPLPEEVKGFDSPELPIISSDVEMSVFGVELISILNSNSLNFSFRVRIVCGKQSVSGRSPTKRAVCPYQTGLKSFGST